MKENINGTIYLIKQISTGKCYVGQTTLDPYERMKQHLSSPNSDDFHILLKNNQTDFTFQILRTNIRKQNVLNQFECYYIGYYHCIEEGFNKSMGGSLTNLSNYYLPN